MNSKTLLIIGIIILVLSLFADPIGIGFRPGFGIIQTVGTVLGAGLVVYAIIKLKKKK